LIAIRRHASSEVPHMSWFRTRDVQSEADGVPDAAFEEQE
jgi:hypothetical protein